MMALSLLLASCRKSSAYDFLNPTNEISEIAVVELSFRENGDLTETEIQKIEDIQEFLDDFQDLPCYVYFGDPTGATPEGDADTVIRIVYENGEYEWINWNGQSKYTLEKGFCYYAGYRVFDEQPFESLLENILREP